MVSEVDRVIKRWMGINTATSHGRASRSARLRAVVVNREGKLCSQVSQNQFLSRGLAVQLRQGVRARIGKIAIYPKVIRWRGISIYGRRRPSFLPPDDVERYLTTTSVGGSE